MISFKKRYIRDSSFIAVSDPQGGGDCKTPIYYSIPGINVWEMSLKLKKNNESISLNCDLKGTEYMISKFYYCHEG